MQNDTKIRAKFKELWPYYVLQSALAAGVLAILFLILGEARMVLISAIGSSAFIIFAMPNTTSARPKILIGSHVIGLFCGTVFALTGLPHFIEYPAAVGLAIFLMVALDLEHPPAAGTAIATVAYKASLEIWVAVIASAVALSCARYLLRNHLRNLI